MNEPQTKELPREKIMFHESQFPRETYLYAMNRKKWTPQEAVTEDALRFREKRKWQIALRRYLLDKQPSPHYAPYFGLDIETFRDWIALQFDSECTWESFSKNWQLELMIPASYFDFGSEADLKLAWNFTNIRVDILSKTGDHGNKLHLLAAKKYFTDLFESTQYEVCRRMVGKIEQIEYQKVPGIKAYESFIAGQLDYIQTLSSFTQEEFHKLNTGMPVDKVIEETAVLKKMGY